MNYQPLKYIYQPSGNGATDTLLLLLHGTGGDERDLLPLAERFGNNLNVLSVRGNVQENGMPRFFRRLAMGVFDEADVRFRTHELVHFLRELAAKEGFDVNRITALGYSNGANIAGGVLLLYPELLAGAMLLRPMQPLKTWDTTLKTNREQPVFMSSGRFDPTVDPAATDRYEHVLKTQGFRVTRQDLETGHNLVGQDISLAVQWYQTHAQPA